MRALVLVGALALACDGEAKPGAGDGGARKGDAVVRGDGAADMGPPDTLTGRQDGRLLCPMGLTTGPDLIIDAVGVRLVGFCNSGAVEVRLQGDAASGALRCTGVDTSRPCPQTVLRNNPDGSIREMSLGEARGEARVEAGRLTGTCTCAMPPDGGLPGRTTEATFDVAWRTP